MKRALFALLTLLAVSAARASDLATTYHFDPALTHELSPARRLFHLDFWQITSLQVVFLAIVGPAMVWLYCGHAAKPMPFAPANLREFVSFQLFNRVMPTGELLLSFICRLPKNWIQGIRFVGITAFWALTFASFLAALSWWAINAWHWTTYRQIRASVTVFNYPVLEILAIIAFWAFASYVYWRIEFAEYRHSHNNAA